MKLTIIGCSGSMSGPEGAASAYLLQALGTDPNTGNPRTFSIVLDFGPGAMGQLMRYMDPAELDAMVLSHLHADHVVDIVGMHVYRRWFPTGPCSRIPVYSPEDGLKRTREISGDPMEETYANEFDFVTIAPGDSVTVGPMTLEFFQAEHPVPAVGIRVTGPSDVTGGAATFYYTGDTDFTQTQVDGARGVDVLLSEAAFESGRDSVRGIHMDGIRAGEMAAQAGVGKLLLTHLQPWTSPEKNESDAAIAFSGPVEAVKPGASYTF